MLWFELATLLRLRASPLNFQVGTPMHGSDVEAIQTSPRLEDIAAAAQLDLGFAQQRLKLLDSATIDEVALPTTIVKRDGRIVFFDPVRIEHALSRCFTALGRTPYTPIPELAL